MVIQVYALTSNAEEAEVEGFYDQIQKCWVKQCCVCVCVSLGLLPL